MHRQLGDVLAEEADAPRAWRKIASYGVEERRLAGTIGAKHGAALARAHRERHILDGLERAERPGDALEHESITRGEWPDSGGKRHYRRHARATSVTVSAPSRTVRNVARAQSHFLELLLAEP